MNKREYVRKAPVVRDHQCHWPGCTRDVKPAYWGCQTHWFRLPKPLRDKVWETYRPRQEVTKTPSAEYLKVADEIQEFARDYETRNTAARKNKERARTSSGRVLVDCPRVDVPTGGHR